MDVRKIVVIVEESEVAKTALRWALHNLIRFGDLITLLHVFTSRSRSKRKIRALRLKGFQLALSFQDICNHFFVNSEIVVTEGDDEGMKIAAVVREIGASMLVAGLHERSFLYKLATREKTIGNKLNCKVIGIKQPERNARFESSTNMDFSQIDLSTLEPPEIPRPKIPYRICPSPSAIIWRSRKSRRKTNSS